MTFKVYYDDVDGELYPKWVLLPNLNDDFTYNIKNPFQRFYQEDFYEGLKLLTVTQGALSLSDDIPYKFKINIEQLELDISKQGIPEDAIYDTEYFIILVDDLEELLQFKVRDIDFQ